MGHEDMEGGQRNRSTLSLTSALDWVGGQSHVPAALPLGKTQYPLYKKLGGSQARSGLVQKIPTPPGFDPRTDQPAVSRYTDCGIPVQTWKKRDM
jgi:hypothetical protein